MGTKKTNCIDTPIKRLPGQGLREERRWKRHSERLSQRWRRGKLLPRKIKEGSVLRSCRAQWYASVRFHFTPRHLCDGKSGLRFPMVGAGLGNGCIVVELALRLPRSGCGRARVGRRTPALMGTIVKGQSRAILPIRFPRCRASSAH